MSIELKPCPFCGDTPTHDNIRADGNQGPKWGSVICSCGVVGPEVRTGYRPMNEWADKAVVEWNTRAESALQQQGEADAVYQFECDGNWVDCTKEHFEGHDGSEKRILYTHPPKPVVSGIVEVTRKYHPDAEHVVNVICDTVESAMRVEAALETTLGVKS